MTLIAAASVYPFGRTLLAPLLVGYAVLLWWRPPLWLFLVPAMLPVLDLAPWTGWFHLEEVDLLLLITGTIGYARTTREARHASLPRWFRVALATVVLAYLIAAIRAMLPFPMPQRSDFFNYLTPYCALRLLKSWCWIILLLPLLTRHAGPGLGRIDTHFVPGMLTGLAFVAIADILERANFPGLLNFASDYRTSAPFSSMHTGGATLDGWLALSLPLLAFWFAKGQNRLHTMLAPVLLSIGAYAALTTFSRALFAALLSSCIVLFTLPLMAAWRKRTQAWPQVGRSVLLLCALLYVLVTTFASAGYRGMFAALIVAGAGSLLFGNVQARRVAVLACVAIVLEATALGLLTLAPTASIGLFKPPYFLFLVSTAAFAIYSTGQRDQRHRNAAPDACVVAFLCMLQSAALINFHWAGRPGLFASLPAIFLILAWGVSNTLAKRAFTRSGESLRYAMIGSIVLACCVPIAVSYYAGQRFGSSGADLHTRLRHWRQVVGMIAPDPWTRIFGNGLGTFPAAYFWHNPNGETPSSLAYLESDGIAFLRLTTPSYRQGYGEVLRIFQRVAIVPHTRYLVRMDARRSAGRAMLELAMCERQLLYPQNCVPVPIRLVGPDAQWRHYSVVIDSNHLNGAAWPMRAPTDLELAVVGEHDSVDIRNVSLRALDSDDELIRNGGFADAGNYWFFSSDHYHFPWHVKNLGLSLLFELGWFGLFAFAGLLAASMLALLRRSLRGASHAPVWFASLTGFLAIGLFDSLLDVPRATLMFVLLLCTAMLTPSPGVHATASDQR